MELLYLYIGGRENVSDSRYRYLQDTPYKVLKDIELNFSNRYKISFDRKHEKLILEDNTAFVPNFFDPTGKIKSITGIIGRNGTGKSTILDFIKSLRKDNYQHHINKIIAVFSDEILEIRGEKRPTFKIYYHPELIFTPSTTIKGLEKEFVGNAKFSIKELTNDIGILPTYTLIYYSPLYENKDTSIRDAHEVYGDENLEDISTTNLLESDAETQINYTEQDISAKDLIRRHKLMETERQVKFIYSVKNARDYLDFEPPKVLELGVDRIDEKILLKAANGPLTNTFRQFGDYVKTNKFNPKEEFIFQIHRAALFNTLRYFIQNSTLFQDIYKVLDSLNGDVSPASIRTFIQRLKEEFTTMLKLRESNPENNTIVIRLGKLQVFLDEIIGLGSDYFGLLGEADPRAYLDMRNAREFSLLTGYFESVSLSGFIVLEWRFSRIDSGLMSSGERGLITIFSRFYYAATKIQRFETGVKSLLILIDEGDQLFHPEWQRKFMDLILKYFSEIFKFVDSIQIILTTHSPFIASDLPPYSIIKLDKNKSDGITFVKNTSAEKSTFAANIHELFTDSFYMENGLVGEFAIRKVKEMFDKINDPGKIDAQIFKEIALVGEPFVKFSLTEKLRERQGNNE